MEGNDTNNNHPHSPRLNIFPILIIAIILYIFFKVDINSLINSPQLQKNISYIKNTVTNMIPKNKIDVNAILNSAKIPQMPNVGAPTNFDTVHGTTTNTRNTQ